MSVDSEGSRRAVDDGLNEATEERGSGGRRAVADGSRERDSAELPEAMRRDVRLLGDVLGEIISEDDPTLLQDVERLRHAAIAARAGERADAEIVALVGAWSRGRA